MDNNRTYINILIDTLKTKSKILDDIIVLTKEQDSLLSQGAGMDTDSFDELVDKKGSYIEKINDLNDGFESLFSRIKDDFILKKNEYVKEIKDLQELINNVTEKSIMIQAQEEKNKAKFDLYLTSKRKEIRNFKVSSNTVSKYYKNMADQHQGQSYFLDKKK